MLNAGYSPTEIEDKWYAHWMEQGYFHSEPDEKEAYSIVIPPPNVTGILHMGHMLNNTIQDTLIRKARMDGKNACWVAGTDHASIATEAKVVRWLREEKGIKKSDLSREEFLAYAWQWTDKYGGIILQQLQKLGASCDWDRTAFTLDKTRSEGVFKAFVDLYDSGKLYRDFRMINWDVEAKTVLSNEEVIYSEEQSQLYHVRYKVAETEDEWITIATQRPETIMGDTAVAVHPKDPRYAHLKGKFVIVPLINRHIPIIFDEYVDIDFGTGALKVTPAHDPNDYELGKKHKLQTINTINDDGTLNANAELPELIGLDRNIARKKMKKLLEESGNFIKLESYMTKIGRSERTNSVVEPKLSLQWYVDTKAIAKPALDAVMNDEISFFPKMYKNTYRHWMENIRDWCISRQLWWGHQIPAWYLVDKTQGDHVFVALTAEEALVIAIEKTGNPDLKASDLVQDQDALDTWFSSWLWPITVFDGFNPESKDFAYYYPTSVLVTGWDIIFLWVARMAMAGFEWKNELPFKDVYFTGMVRDKQGRKMSKQLGNSPDALELIEKFGADGVRFGMLSCSPAGGDLLYDDKLCEQGRSFCNKMWNALKLIKGWEVTETEQPAVNALAIKWFKTKSHQIQAEAQNNFAQYRLSESLMDLYNFIWGDFCSWYLEIIKPEFGKPIDKKTLEQTIDILESLMTMLHPYMPFVTEEIWHQLRHRHKGHDCMTSQTMKLGKVDKELIGKVETAKEIVSKMRETRNSKGLKMKESLPLFVIESESVEDLFAMSGIKEMITKLSNLSELSQVAVESQNSVGFIAGKDRFFIELAQDSIDVEAERLKMTKELEHARGFIKSVESKLNNERFVGSAPAQVLDNERKKLADGLARVKILEESLAKIWK
jgi:valyl-tRNA synthetase